MPKKEAKRQRKRKESVKLSHKRHKPERSQKPPKSKRDKSKDKIVPTKVKQKQAKKQESKLEFNIDPKLKNKNHKHKTKDWKSGSNKMAKGTEKGVKGSEEEQRVILRKTYNKMMESNKDKAKAQELAESCITLMGDKLSNYAFKRDGSMIIQACIKHGSEDQIQRIKKAYKENFYKLMQEKYGRFLAKKLYEDCFDVLEKKAVLEHICNNMDKYMIHMYVTDIIEHIYLKGNKEIKRKIFDATFGAKFKFIKEAKGITEDDIEKIFIDNPLIKEQVIEKLRKQVDVFISKGLVRLHFVQRIILFYVRNSSQEGIEKILEEGHKNYLALLDSKDGVYAACIIFTAANSKHRKHMIKQLRTEAENYVDNMLSSHLGTVFLLKALLTMDDTKVTSKIILDRVLELLPNVATNQMGSRMLAALCSNNIPKYFNAEDQEILSYNKYTTSKKDNDVRKEELLEYLFEGLRQQLPGLMKDNLSNKAFSTLIGEVLVYIVKGHYEVNKEIVNAFIEGIKDEMDAVSVVVNYVLKEEAKIDEGHVFAIAISKVVKGRIEKLLESKGVFIVCKLLKVEEAQKVIRKELLSNSQKVKQLIEKTEHNSGLKEIEEYIDKHQNNSQ